MLLRNSSMIAFGLLAACCAAQEQQAERFQGLVQAVHGSRQAAPTLRTKMGASDLKIAAEIASLTDVQLRAVFGGDASLASARMQAMDSSEAAMYAFAISYPNVELVPSDFPSMTPVEASFRARCLAFRTANGAKLCSACTQGHDPQGIVEGRLATFATNAIKQAAVADNGSLYLNAASESLNALSCMIASSGDAANPTHIRVAASIARDLESRMAGNDPSSIAKLSSRFDFRARPRDYGVSNGDGVLTDVEHSINNIVGTAIRLAKDEADEALQGDEGPTLVSASGWSSWWWLALILVSTPCASLAAMYVFVVVRAVKWPRYPPPV